MRLVSPFTGQPNLKRSAWKDGVLVVVRYAVIFSLVCLANKGRILFPIFRSETVSAMDTTPVDVSGIEVIVHNGLRRQTGTRYSPLLPGASFVESRLKERKLEQNGLGPSASYPEDQVVDTV